MQDGVVFEPFTLARGARAAGLAQAAERWGRLAFASAIAFIANLYASPAFYWPELFEPLRLGLATSALCAFAVLMRRITSGERFRLGGGPSAFLFAFALLAPLSWAWTISSARTTEAVIETIKLIILYVAIINALDTPGRVRAFLVVGALATLAPALGSIARWVNDEALVDGYRTAWRGNYADPNRLAMALILFIPIALALVRVVERRTLRLALAVAAGAGIVAVVLTHSRSGAVALGASLLFVLLRGRHKRRGLVMAIALGIALVTWAPSSFWSRSRSIADYAEDASFAGRERAYRMLRVIVDERPSGGVGAGAFLDAWERFAPLPATGPHLIAHNIFMEILGEQGFPGLILFAIFCAWLSLLLWRAGEDPGVGLEARALFAGLLGYLVCELVNGYSRAFNLYAAFGGAMAIVAQARLRAHLATAPERHRRPV